MKTLDTIIEAFITEAILKGQVIAYDEAMGRWTEVETDSGRLTLRCTTEATLQEMRDEAQETLEELQKVLYPEVECDTS